MDQPLLDLQQQVNKWLGGCYGFLQSESIQQGAAIWRQHVLGSPACVRLASRPQQQPGLTGM